MSLLLSNDDGVHAPGLRVLAETLQQAGYGISVVAPNRDRSGASNSLSLDRPLQPMTLENGFITLDGTPTDCVAPDGSLQYPESGHKVHPAH